MVQINDIVPRLMLQARTDQHNNVDHLGGHLPIIATGHRFVHLGVHFFDVNTAELDNSDTSFHLISTPAHGDFETECHLLIAVETALKSTVELYEGVTGTTPTTVPFNSRRDSANVAESRVGNAFTGYTGGTLLEQFYLGSSGRYRAGGSGSRDDEIILKQSTTYALKVTSHAASNRIFSRFSWYEIGANIIGGSV